MGRTFFVLMVLLSVLWAPRFGFSDSAPLMISALGVGLVVSATNVKYRDVGHAIPFVMQIWMFVSPIVYPVSLVPEKWRFIYGLNPMAGVIEGFRWALLEQTAPDLMVMAASFVVFVVFLLASLVYFRQMERQFADVI